MPKKADSLTRFELDGEVLELDLNDLTFGEIEILEEYFQCLVEDIPWGSTRSALMLAYLAKRRKDPTTTLDDLRDIKVSAFSEAKSKRPTKAAPEDSGSQS